MGTLQVWLTVIIPVVLGSAFIAGSNILKRLLLGNKQLSPLQFLVIGYGGITALSGLFYVVCYGFTLPPTLLTGFWTAVFCGAGANFIIQFLNAKAASIDAGEVSLTAPLQAMTPGLITILAVALGELPGKVGILGVFLMASASWMLLAKPKKDQQGNVVGYHYFAPLGHTLSLLRLRSLSSEERGRALVVSMALGSAAMGTVGLLFDGLYTRRGVDFQGLVMAMIVLIGSLAVGYAIWYILKPDATPGQVANFRALLTSGRIPVPVAASANPKPATGLLALRVDGRRFLLFVFLFAAVWTLHWFLIQPTFNKAFVAYVGTLKRFHILIAVVLGHFLFQEGEFKRRLWAATLVVAGAICISLDDIPTRLSTRIEGFGF